jgi:hypothetical protein
MDRDHYAKEAERLLRDDVLNFALDLIREEALEELATADPADMVTLLRHQQTVAVVDGIRGELRGATLRLSNANPARGSFA